MGRHCTTELIPECRKRTITNNVHEYKKTNVLLRKKSISDKLNSTRT